MNSKQMDFFSTSDDLRLILDSAVRKFDFSIVKIEEVEAPRLNGLVSRIPDFCIAKKGDCNFEDAYLLVEPSVVPLVRRIETRSGGSSKNWTTRVKDKKTVVLVQDFPRAKAQRCIDKGEAWIKIVPGVNDLYHDALKLERERLIARLAQIDVILSPDQTDLLQAESTQQTVAAAQSRRI